MIKWIINRVTISLSLIIFRAGFGGTERRRWSRNLFSSCLHKLCTRIYRLKIARRHSYSAIQDLIKSTKNLTWRQRVFFKNINRCVSLSRSDMDWFRAGHSAVGSGLALGLVDKAECSVFGVAVPLSLLFPDLCVTDRFDICVTEKKNVIVKPRPEDQEATLLCYNQLCSVPASMQNRPRPHHDAS